MRKYAVVTIMLVLMALFAISSCRTPAGRTTGDVVDDATITSKVKSKLLLDDKIKGLAIDVDTFEGNVTLTGAVRSPEQKKLAEDLARSVYGVKKVNNLLAVRAP